MRTSVSMIFSACCVGWGLRSVVGAATTSSGGKASELINLQREGSRAKVYQVRRVRQVLLRYGLEGQKE